MLVQAGSVLVAVDVSFQSPPEADAFVDLMRCCARQTFACVPVTSSTPTPLDTPLSGLARLGHRRLTR